MSDQNEMGDSNLLVRIAELEDENIRLKEMLRQADEIEKELRANLRNATELAVEDELTGLPNRRALFGAIGKGISHIQENPHRRRTEQDVAYGLIYFDLDKFKNINDTSGHLAGDAVLKQVSHDLVEAMRDDDVVARIGGDEFVVLIEIFNQAELPHLAERVRRTVAETTTDYKGSIWKTRASIGCTLLVSSDSPESALARADEAMYEAKKIQNPSGAIHFVSP